MYGRNYAEQESTYSPVVIIKMAKRLKLNFEEFGGTKDPDHSWWRGPFSAFVVSLYNKRFGKSHRISHIG